MMLDNEPIAIAMGSSIDLVCAFYPASRDQNPVSAILSH